MTTREAFTKLQQAKAAKAAKASPAPTKHPLLDHQGIGSMFRNAMLKERQS